MLLQCAADFHGRRERYRKFLDIYKERKPDLVIIAGDFGNGDEEFFSEIESPIYGVYGNMDGDLSHLKEFVTFVDGEKFVHEGINFLGVGSKYPENVEGKIDIIISHVPPYRTKDRAFFGMHIGSKWLRNLMEEKKPFYVICGHVHEDAGYEIFGETYVVNCSVGKKGVATLIDFDKKKIEMIGY
ncbi:MAG: hypothetical protein DRN29_03265 [Thermoplasmata archaeon]|nr:MAG: hypothetical protein DRN29_03265 [Thermoplasmata archaeon]